MIRGNRIIFGYGTIAIKGWINHLSFTEIKSPQKVGSEINPTDGSIKHLTKVIIVATIEEFERLNNILLKNDFDINKEIEFQGYVLDFSNFNKDSVNVLSQSLIKAMGACQLILAC